MKKLAAFFALMLFSLTSWSQTTDIPYNESLAKKLGADDLGMKSYTLVILETGDVTVEPGTLRDSLFASHMKNIQQLAADGRLVLAGPLGKNPLRYRGIFVLNTTDLPTARKWVDADAAVRHGVFHVTFMPFYASAALMELNAIHQQIQRKTITE